MDKFFLADMITDRLEKEIGMTAKPFPAEIKTLKKALPSGELCFETALYQAEKLKKIVICRQRYGEDGAGTLVMLAAEDDYDLPFTLANIAYDFGVKGKIFTEFEPTLLVKDEESTKKYVDPLTHWCEEIANIPSEPVTGFMDPGEFLKSQEPPTKYMRFVSYDYNDQILEFAKKFFDIYLEMYRKAAPVTDDQRKRKMHSFKSEWNKHILPDDPSGVMITGTFGQETAELFYDHFVYL